MGKDSIVDSLIQRIIFFEKCYLGDHVSLLSDIEFYAEHLMRGSFDVLDEATCRHDLESRLTLIEEYYSGLPAELAVIDPCNAHLSLLGEFWNRYYSESWNFFEEGDYNKGRIYVAEMGLTYVAESLLRCVCLDETRKDTIENIEEIILPMRFTRQVIESSDRMEIELNFLLGNLITKTDRLLQMIMNESICDEDFAPLVVSCFMLQDLRYWADALLANYNCESLQKVRDLSLVMSQLGSIFKQKYDKTLRVLRTIPGYEGFETSIRDIYNWRNLTGQINDNTLTDD